MRPLFHPAIEDVRPGAILHALSDPERLAIFGQIACAGSTNTCSASAKAGDRLIPKSSLSNHMRILREAGLVRSERRGAEMRNFSRCAELDERFPGLLAAILDAYQRAGEGAKTP